MVDTGELTIPLPNRLDVASQLVIVTRFTAALCWLGVLATLAISTGGARWLLIVPVIVAAVAVWASHYRRGQNLNGRRSSSTQARGMATTFPSALGKTVILPLIGAAALSWVLVATVVFDGNSAAIVLTAFPLVMTLAAYAASRRLRRLLAETGH